MSVVAVGVSPELARRGPRWKADAEVARPEAGLETLTRVACLAGRTQGPHDFLHRAPGLEPDEHQVNRRTPVSFRS